MTLHSSLLCSAIALAIGLSAIPAAQAAESGDGMSKMSSGGMMKKDTMMMKKHKKHKDSMMKGDGDAMKKDDAAPAQ